MVESAAATDNSSLILARLVEELTERLQAGESIKLEELAREYPDYEGRLRELVPAMSLLVDLGASVSGDGSPPSPSDTENEKLGDFRIIREIGRGGMGVVYEAEQVSLSRRVALKVLPFAAVLDPKQLQRFKNESLAAAQLDHPHIVPVYGVGCERGVHFYAMRYIEGKTLAELIQQRRQTNKLDLPPTKTKTEIRNPKSEIGSEPPETSSALRAPSSALPDTGPLAALSTEHSQQSPQFFRSVCEIGIQVAEALDHAHQQGIVHRDIKPSNLMLDANGKAWVTDFGLAHVETDLSLTMTGDLIGTLRYMSPEQALAKRAVIDHRTDIYSLGVTLYELLTLHPAFTGTDRQEILRQIAFEEPPAPRKLNRSIPAELETIALKAMAKNAAERYGTAQELADDLKRFLEHKPILARRPSLVQRAVKWSRRHKPVVVSASVSAVLLLIMAVVGLSISNSVIFSKEQAKTKALAEKDDALFQKDAALEQKQAALAAAEKAFLRAHGMVGEFFTDVSESEELLKGTPGTQELRKRLLERARSYYEDFVRQRAGDEKLQHDLGKAHFRLAYIASATGEKAKALAEYQRALAIQKRLVRRNPTATEYQNRLAGSYHDIGSLHKETGKPAEALAAFQKALEIFEWLARENPTVTNYQTNLAVSYNNINFLHKETGKPAEALAACEQALEIFKRLARQNPTVTDYQSGLAVSYNNIGTLHIQTGALAEGLAAYQKALEILERLTRENPTVIEYQNRLALSYNNTGLLHKKTGKQVEALAAYQKALEIQKQLARENPSITKYQNLLAAIYNNIGNLQSDTGKPAEALALHEKAIDIQERLTRENPTVIEYQNSLAKSYNNTGLLHKETGKRAEALAAYEKSFVIYKRLARQNPTVIEYQFGLAVGYNNIAILHLQTGKPAEALAAYQQALEIVERLARQNPTVTEYQHRLALSYNNIGLLHGETGKPAKALAAHQQALEIQERLVRQNPTVTGFQSGLAKVYSSIGTLQNETGKKAEALAAYEQALKIRERLAQENPKGIEFALSLGGSYCNQGNLVRKTGDPEQALDWYGRAIETLEGVLDRVPAHTTARLFLRNSHWGRAKVLKILKRHAEAVVDLRRALELDTGRDRQLLRVLLTVSLARAGEHVQACREARVLAEAADANGSLLYNLACVFSLASAAAAQDASLSDEERKNLTDDYAAQAIDLLNQAQAAGFFKQVANRELAGKDSDLDPIRQRGDFRKFLQQIEADFAKQSEEQNGPAAPALPEDK